MKKKLLMVFLAAALAASTAACGNGGKSDAKTEDSKKENTKADDTKADDTPQAESKADAISYQADECVKLGDYSKLAVTVTGDFEVTQADIEEYAQGMAQYYAQPTYKDTDKKTVEDGDTVNIDYEGKKDGVAFDGGTASGYNLTIGSGSFIDGFEDGLIGKNVGDTVELNLTFPEDYQSKELAGKDVVFTVKINKIVEEDKKADVELTDEYVSANFGYDTVEAYKDKVKEYLETTNESQKKQSTRQAVINKLLEVCEVTIPDGLLEARVDDYVVEFTNKNCKDTTLEKYLDSNYNGMTEKDFREQLTTEMQTNLKTELMLEAIAKKENVKLDEDKFAEYVKQQMTSGSYQTEEDFYKANGVNEASGEKYERKVYVCNTALDKVMDNASITYKAPAEDTAAE